MSQIVSQSTAQNFFKTVRETRSADGVRERTAASKSWLLKNAEALYNDRGMNRNDLLSPYGGAKNRDKIIGRLYMFVYEPKHRQTLPYYDRFPVVFILGPYDDGFLGLNMHYLPPRIRLSLFNSLMKLASNANLTDRTRLKLSYELIAGISTYRYAMPCIKRYLTSHIRSRVAEIPADEWDIALFLPTENFAKTSMEKVWSDSRKKINSR
jgi:hypothetical protein